MKPIAVLVDYGGTGAKLLLRFMPPTSPHNRPMPSRDELLELDDKTLLGHCHQECYRASGPGGQHKNTTDSAVRLTLNGGAAVALCADHRSQHRNRADALRRLRRAIAINIRRPIMPDEASSREAEKGPEEKWNGSWKLGRKDRRYAGFLAHVFDVMESRQWAVGLSADALGISTGRLVRVLARDPNAWNAVNQARAKLELVNLRRP